MGALLVLFYRKPLLSSANHYALIASAQSIEFNLVLKLSLKLIRSFGRYEDFLRYY